MEKIYVTKAALPPMEEYIEEIKSIWDSHWLTNMGEKHNTLETQLKDYLGVPNISLFVNGHMALELAIQAMNLTGEVITTPFTFASTTHAIIRNGLTPVFCDINPDNYTIDVDKIEQLITNKTTAIIPVHVYGNICDIERINEIAHTYNLKVIYDAAHAFGIKYKGIGIGNFGDASMFSFHATKVFHTIEGGAVSFKNTEVGEKLYKLKNFGIKNAESVDGVGANGKMNEFEAAMGICNLRHINEQIENRRIRVEYYNKRLENIPGLQLCKKQEDVKSNYSYYPVLIDATKCGLKRDELFDKLAEHGINTRKYFYPLTNSYECFNGMFDINQTPTALRISNQVLTLPLYSDMPFESLEKICDIIISSCKS